MYITRKTSLQSIMNYTYFKHVLIKFKNGKKHKYFILDTTDAIEGTNSGKDEIVYMTSHDKDASGHDRYGGNGIPIDKIEYIKVLD